MRVKAAGKRMRWTSRRRISRANFKFLWKIKLGQTTNAKRTFSEPLLAGRLINAQGFKDIVYWSSADTLYAVDSELGSIVWKQEFKSSLPARAGCEFVQPAAY